MFANPKIAETKNEVADMGQKFLFVQLGYELGTPYLRRPKANQY